MSRGGRASDWPIFLYDRRDSYLRTHRLLIDPGPFRKLASELGSPLFDELMSFLEEADFRPEVNRLEARLHDLVRTVGVQRELLAIGEGVGEFGIGALRERVAEAGRLDPDSPLTVVAADSVHSATRALVVGDDPSIAKTHQVVTRLRVEGPGISERLGYLEQFKMAKLLGSALDYRRNANGFAEVDLFLDAEEQDAVERLGATPASPVRVTRDTVAGAVLFSSVVSAFEEGFGSGACAVHVQSTFRLEHRHQTSVVFEMGTSPTTVLLVGDAAVSLPFFRGMACLAKCADALSSCLVGWAESAGENDSLFVGYQRSVERIRADEIQVVARRSRTLALASRLIRISSLVPFPIQQWLLDKTPPAWTRGRFTQLIVLNLAVAVLAAVVALGASVAGVLVSAPLGWLWLAAVPVELAGGAFAQKHSTHRRSREPATRSNLACTDRPLGGHRRAGHCLGERRRRPARSALRCSWLVSARAGVRDRHGRRRADRGAFFW